MTLILVGLNHKTAPIEVRERLSMSADTLPALLCDLKARQGVGECAILSTCNRTEMYAVTDDEPGISKELLSDFLGEARELPRDSYARHLYSHSGPPAVTHLFTVSSGLDSMIVGENQILGQVRQAYVTAQEAKVTGPILERLFPWALKVGKLARSKTRINEGASSVSAAAVELARKIFGDLQDRRVMLLGAGEMGQTALKLLLNAGVKRISVVNRTFDTAAKVAEECGGEAVPFEQLDQTLSEVDVLLSSTGAPHYVVTRDRLVGIMRARRGRPLFLVDIAVPRDIEPSCEEIENVYLYNIDDLQQAVDQNLARRHSEVQQVLEIVESQTLEFVRYLDSRKASGSIVKLRTSFEQVRLQELDTFVEKQSLSDKEAALVERFSKRLINKLLHAPTERLRRLSGGGASPEDLNRSLELLGLSEMGDGDDE